MSNVKGIKWYAQYCNTTSTRMYGTLQLVCVCRHWGVFKLSNLLDFEQRERKEGGEMDGIDPKENKQQIWNFWKCWSLEKKSKTKIQNIRSPERLRFGQITMYNFFYQCAKQKDCDDVVESRVKINSFIQWIFIKTLEIHTKSSSIPIISVEPIYKFQFLVLNISPPHLSLADRTISRFAFAAFAIFSIDCSFFGRAWSGTRRHIYIKPSSRSFEIIGWLPGGETYMD